MTVRFPQVGHCLCGEIEYQLKEDPLTVYLCHCTDCQTQSGSGFAISMIVREEALEFVRGTPRLTTTELADGRTKRSRDCATCGVRLAGFSSVEGVGVIEPGTLDDTSWFWPVGHIWAKSAQPWFEIPQDSIVVSEQPDQEQILDLVRAWKNQRAALESAED